MDQDKEREIMEAYTIRPIWNGFIVVREDDAHESITEHYFPTTEKIFEYLRPLLKGYDESES